MLHRRSLYLAAALLVTMTFTITGAKAQNTSGPGTGAGPNAANCGGLPSQAALEMALASALAAENSGLNNQMWATIVNRDGEVCAVAFSGVNRGAQWPGSRVISAQKANTANAFSLDFSSRSSGKAQANR